MGQLLGPGEDADAVIERGIEILRTDVEVAVGIPFSVSFIMPDPIENHSQALVTLSGPRPVTSVSHAFATAHHNRSHS